MKKNNSFAQSGFTLVELMITIAIAAILLTIAVPSFQTTIMNNKLYSQSNKLLTDLHFSRNEAIKRGRNIVVCRSDSPEASTPACNTNSSKDWGTGWIIFDDSGTNSNDFDAGDVLLRRSSNESNIVVESNASAANYVAFNSSGQLGNGSMVLVALCDDRDGDGQYIPSHGKQISISPVGFPSIISSPTFNSNCEF